MTLAPGSYLGLTPRQSQVLSYLRERAAVGDCPKYDEISAATGIRSVGKKLDVLQLRGFITRIPGQRRAIRVLPDATGLAAYSTRQLRDELYRRETGA